MNQSLKSLLKLLIRLKLDAAVIVSKANKFYFSGYEYEEGYLALSRHDIKLFVDPRFSIYARQKVKDVDVIDSRQPAAGVNRFLKKFKSIGIDSSAISYRDFMAIASNTGKQTFHPIDNHLLKIRAVKDEDEISYIRKASESSGNALNVLLKKIAPDMSERQIASILDFELINAGADNISFDTVVAFDERAAYAHAIPSNDVELRGKRLMLCDFGAVFKGYHSDETHTFFLNKLDDDEKKVYNAVLEAHNRAIDAVKPGIQASKLDRVARDFLDKQGYGRYFGHALGHGVGLDIHESPFINYRSKDIIKSGMVFTIEPGVYIPDWGGVRIESMIYLSDDNKEILTKRSGPVINLEG